MIQALTTAEYALVVSMGALVTSVTALGFQLWQALRLDRASLRVEVAAMVLIGGGESLRVVQVTVVNHGKRPTSLTSMWLVTTAGRWSHRRWWPKPLRRNVGLVVTTPHPLLPQPTIPGPLEVGGQVDLYYVISLLEEGIREHKVRYFHGRATASTASGRSRLVKRRNMLSDLD